MRKDPYRLTLQLHACQLELSANQAAPDVAYSDTMLSPPLMGLLIISAHGIVLFDPNFNHQGIVYTRHVKDSQVQ